jgi:uroporphyrinogen-III synthase
MRRVIVLRPEPGASETVARARALGLEALAVPLFAIEPVAWTRPEGAFDGLLLTSANAVRSAGPGLEELRGLGAYAVGEATARAARGAGFDIAATGEEGVERLLGSIESDLRLLHLCGEDRTMVTARQAITPVVVYRAAALETPELRIGDGDVVLIHSRRAGRRLGELVEDRASVAVAAISAAAADAAGGGWGAIDAAETPADDARLALAARLCNKPRP